MAFAFPTFPNALGRHGPKLALSQWCIAVAGQFC